MSKEPGTWRELRHYNEADLRAAGWSCKEGVWTHPDRAGESFTFHQAEKCEQFKESKRFYAEEETVAA